MPLIAVGMGLAGEPNTANENSHSYMKNYLLDMKIKQQLNRLNDIFCIQQQNTYNKDEYEDLETTNS